MQDETNSEVSSDRRLHVLGVSELARGKFPGDPEAIEACEMHDIGYFNRATGFHPVDGFLHCRGKTSEAVALAVLHHGNSQKLAPADLHHFYGANPPTDKSARLTKLVDWCDMRVDSGGRRVSPTERWLDVRKRHGNHSLVSVSFRELMEKRDSVVFLDVDGVLTDFYRAVYEAAGVDMPTKNGDWPERGRDVLRKTGVGGWEELHRRNADLWRRMPCLGDGLELLAELRSHDVEPHILTSPPPYGPAIAGRYEALQGPPFYCPLLTFSNEKHHLAKRQHILIDDTPSNIADWRGAGGTGILWEQPWNSEEPDNSGVTDRVLELVGVLRYPRG